MAIGYFQHVPTRKVGDVRQLDRLLCSAVRGACFFCAYLEAFTVYTEFPPAQSVLLPRRISQPIDLLHRCKRGVHFSATRSKSLGAGRAAQRHDGAWPNQLTDVGR